MAAERFEMRMDEAMGARIDEWRAKQEDLPGRSEAVRRLIEEALAKSSGSQVEITDGEKLLLLMLGEVHKHLKVKGEIDPDFLAEVIYGGHYWAPAWRMTGVFHGHRDKPENLHFVVDTMDMWSFIEDGYKNLSKKDKDIVEKEADPFGKNPRFSGFDGNREGELIGIARFLIEKLDRFSTFQKRDLNSHFPTVETYRRMLAVFEPIRNTLVGGELSAKQLIAILGARRYPNK